MGLVTNSVIMGQSCSWILQLGLMFWLMEPYYSTPSLLDEVEQQA